jgi:hypothetical protein
LFQYSAATVAGPLLKQQSVPTPPEQCRINMKLKYVDWATSRQPPQKLPK